MTSEHDTQKMEPIRSRAAQRKIRHYTNSTKESIASTGLDGDELVAFMADQFVDFVRQEYKPEQPAYTREMGRKALFDDMVYSQASVTRLDEEARKIGYKRNERATEWILRVVSEGARHHLSNYEIGNHPAVELSTGGNDAVADIKAEAVPPGTDLESTLETASTHDRIIDLDDTIRAMYQDKRLPIHTAQALLIVFGKAESPRRSEAIENTIIVTLNQILRKYPLHYKGDGPLKRFATTYLQQINESGVPEANTSAVLAQYSENAWSSLHRDMSEVETGRELVESVVASQIGPLYPIKRP